MEDWKAKQAAKASTVAALRSANPHLMPSDCKGGSLIAAAKNIRIELALAFPKVKFSIKSRRFSMGDAVDVSWTDGPCHKQVDEIIDRYESGTFDGMTDCSGYKRSAWTDAFGDAKFVHSRRECSDAALASAIRTVKMRYAGNLSDMGLPEPTVEALKKGDYRSVSMTGNGLDSLQDVIYRVVYSRTWAITKPYIRKNEEVAA